MAKVRYFGFRDDGAFVSKKCENVDCQREYFIASRFSHMSRFCSDACSNHARYLRRKSTDDIVDTETIDESSNNENLENMDENMKELLRLTHENAALQGQVALLQKEGENAEYHKNEAQSLRNLVGKKDNQLRALNSDMDRVIRENKQLRNEIAELTSEIEDLQEQSQETLDDNILVDSDNVALSEENEKLKENITELKWGCLSLQSKSKGMPDIDGAKIPMTLVSKWFGAEYPIDKAWDVRIWGWHLKHLPGANEVLITKIVK